jgi:hypothetical protein
MGHGVLLQGPSLGTHSELGGNVVDAFRTWWEHIKNFMVLKVLELLYFLAKIVQLFIGPFPALRSCCI